LGAGVERVRAELRKEFGQEWVGGEEDRAPITVGTEASLAGSGVFDLAVVVDADGLFYAPHYRADEEALRIMVRLAGRLSGGTGHRLLVQTSTPGHRVLSALRKGDGIGFLQKELDSRIEMGFPPQGQLMALQVKGGDQKVSERLHSEMAALETGRASIHGPVEFSAGLRWLVDGSDLWEVKGKLRPLVSRWRHRGLAVRVDVDPLDL
jgi:primosomal protein N'